MAPSMVDQLLVKPGSPPRLADRRPGDRLALRSKAEAKTAVEQLIRELDELHNRLWAEAERAVLLVLQGMDTSGKDGTIRRVLTGLNPQGTSVASFKAPTETERGHDYLWRIHTVCPARGHLGVFNRSHYEDVLAARFVADVSPEHCRKRYRHINEFERLLVEEGTTIVKVHLQISKEEQKRRLQARLADPKKTWKFKMDDLDTRKSWDDYMAAYEEVLTETSTHHAPWYVVPGDRKWVRDVAVATLMVETFRGLDPKIPAPDPKLKGLVVE
jgi:PPK2 family polyphosphate:nucleotide phosphotransferase